MYLFFMSSVLTKRIIGKADRKAKAYLEDHKNDCGPMFDFYIGESKRVWKVWHKMFKIKSFGDLKGENLDKLVRNFESVLAAYEDITRTRDCYQTYRL